MKKIATILLMTICLAAITACTAQKPVAQAPTYNITLTDNSQWIMGDGNTAETKATTTSEQTAKPSVEAKSENITSNMWILWLILIASGLGIGYYFLHKKGIL